MTCGPWSWPSAGGTEGSNWWRVSEVEKNTRRKKATERVKRGGKMNESTQAEGEDGEMGS